MENFLAKIFGNPTKKDPQVVPVTQLANRPKSDASAHSNMILGTLLLWIGWFGFNGGSALGSNLRAVSACVSTHLAACSGGLSLCLIRSVSERYFPEDEPIEDPQSPSAITNGNTNGNTTLPASAQASKPKFDTFVFSIADFCNGAITGLVCITPAAGYVPHQISPVFGIVGAIVCWQLTPISYLLLDIQHVFVVHGIGGFVGMLLTGIFARGNVAALDGVTSADSARGGWDGHWHQLL
jgi:Amt family ammonium transporter